MTTTQMEQAHFQPDTIMSNASEQCNSLKETRQPFPFKVYEMLEDADSKGFASIVSWNEHGTGFMVHNKEQFVQKIVPLYFNQTKYKSFQRQLSLYGVSRITVGYDKGLRYHEKLRRGRYDLVCQMKPVGYKPRGTTKILKQQQQAPEFQSQFIVNATADSSISSSEGSTKMIVHSLSSMGMIGDAAAVRTTTEGIPTVISSGSLDKHGAQISPTAFAASHGMISEGEESSGEDQIDEELRDLIEKGLFEGMSFFLMTHNQDCLQEFLAPNDTFQAALTKEHLPSPNEMNEELKKAWRIGYTMALSMKNKETALPQSTPISSSSASLPSNQKPLQLQPGPSPPSSQLILEECVDALDFHTATIASTAGANL